MKNSKTSIYNKQTFDSRFLQPWNWQKKKNNFAGLKNQCHDPKLKKDLPCEY